MTNALTHAALTAVHDSPVFGPQQLGCDEPGAFAAPIKLGEMAICDHQLYKVYEVDSSGFCMLVDCEGETIMRHQRHEALRDPVIRALAQTIADLFEEMS